MSSSEYQRKMEREERASKAWAESERILNILRTESAKPDRKHTMEEIMQWQQKLQAS